MAQVLSRNLFEALQEAEQPSAAPSPAKQAEKKPATAGESKPGQRTRSEYPRRGGFSGKVIQPEDLVADKKDRKPSKDGKSGRGGRGGRGGRHRDFDRRSGTGRVDGEKKDIAGKGAWGDPVEGAGDSAPAAEAETAENTENQTPVEEKEEEKVLTLEQYLASKKPVTVNLAPAAPRKANEGSDNSQWKNATVLKKEEEDFILLRKQESNNAQKKKEDKSKQVKQVLAIEQRFSDQERPAYSGRGGRGRGRGGAPKVNYDREFPALK